MLFTLTLLFFFASFTSRIMKGCESMACMKNLLLDILYLYRDGLDKAQISEKLDVSIETVDDVIKEYYDTII